MWQDNDEVDMTLDDLDRVQAALDEERATTARLREALKSCEGHVHVCHDDDFRECVQALATTNPEKGK